MGNYREFIKDKKRIVIKIGSSSLMHEQTGIGNRVSWLAATIPCILFAIFGVNSFIILTRIMDGVW